jgi:hypothetical protein
MPFSCEFSSAFSTAFAICPTDEAQPDTRYLRGVPSAIPRIRKRPDVTDIRGFGLIPVIGAATLTGEAVLHGQLDQDVELKGRLTADAFRYLIAAIHTGAEAVLTGESALDATADVASTGYGRVVGETHASGVGAIQMILEGHPAAESSVEGRMAVRVGAEGVITGYENEDALIIAAGMLLVKLLDR